MPLTVVGPDDAVLAFGVAIEGARAKDPDYPWMFNVGDRHGPFLDGDGSELTERQHRLLIDLTKQHRDVVVLAGEVDRDSDTGELINADLIRYAKGRRRTVASFHSDAEDRETQIARMIMLSLRYEEQRERA